MISPTWSVLS